MTAPTDDSAATAAGPGDASGDAAEVAAILEARVPGPGLLVALSTDPATVVGEIAEAGMRAGFALECHATWLRLRWLLEACRARAGTTERVLDDPYAAQIAAAALASSATMAAMRLELAHGVLERLPALGQEMAAGRLEERKAWHFVSVLRDLDVATAREVVDRLLGRAAKTPHQKLRDQIESTAAELDPAWDAVRKAAAVARARVLARLRSSGAAELSGLDLPWEDAKDAYDHVVAIADAVAKELAVRGISRSEGTVQSHVFLRLLGRGHLGLDDPDIVVRLTAELAAQPHPDDPDTDDDPRPDDDPDDGPEPNDGPGLDDDGPSGGGPSGGGPSGGGPSGGGPSGGGPSHGGPDSHGPGLDGPDDGPGDRGLASDPDPDDGAGPDLDDLGGPADGGGEGDCGDPPDHDSSGAGCQSPAPDAEDPEPGTDPAPDAEPELDLEFASPPGRAPSHATEAVEAGAGRRLAYRRRVAVRLALGTLLGLDQGPGHMPGWGTVAGPTARHLADQRHAAIWRLLLYNALGVLEYVLLVRPPGHAGDTAADDPHRRQIVELTAHTAELEALDAGACLHPDLVRDARVALAAARDHPERHPAHTMADAAERHPRTALDTWVRGRDQCCRFPGCDRPAYAADLDHTLAVIDGGITVADNLGPLCRYHHRLKHTAGWTLEQPCPGTFVWTAPTGTIHVVEPDPVPPPAAPMNTDPGRHLALLLAPGDHQPAPWTPRRDRHGRISDAARRTAVKIGRHERNRRATPPDPYDDDPPF